MMDPTDRNGELVADLASQGPRLGEAQMVGVGGRSTAYQARLPRHVLAMVLVAQPDGLGRNPAAGGAGPVGKAPSVGGRLQAPVARFAVHQVPVGLGSIVIGFRIIEGREPGLEARFNQLRVGGRQGVLGWQALMRPGGGIVAGLKDREFAEQAIPLERGLVGSKDGGRGWGRRASAAAVQQGAAAACPV